MFEQAPETVSLQFALSLQFIATLFLDLPEPLLSARRSRSATMRFFVSSWQMPTCS